MSEELHVFVTAKELQQHIRDASGGAFTANLKSSAPVSVNATIHHADPHDKTSMPDSLSGDTVTALFEGVEIVETTPTFTTSDSAAAPAPLNDQQVSPSAATTTSMMVMPGFDQTDDSDASTVGASFDEMRLKAPPRKPGQLYFISSIASSASNYRSLLINNTFSRRASSGPSLSTPMARFAQKSAMLFTPTKLRLSPRMRHRVAAFYKQRRKEALKRAAELKKAKAQKIVPIDKYKKMRDAAKKLTTAAFKRGSLFSLSPVLVDNSALKTNLQKAELNKHAVPRGANYSALTNGASALDVAPTLTIAVGKPLEQEDTSPLYVVSVPAEAVGKPLKQEKDDLLEPIRDDSAIEAQRIRNFRRIAASVNDFVPPGGGSGEDDGGGD